MGLSDGEETGLTVAIDSQERIVVGGVSDIEGFALARLTNTGSLDSTFGGDGRVSVNVPLMEEVDLSIAVDGQDQTYVVGTVTNLLGAASYHITRLLESGETDVNYAVDGALQGVLSLLDTATTEIAPPVPDAAGNLLMVYSVDDALTLLQVDSTGTPDVNLDVDGLLTLDTSPTELKVTDVLLDQAGNLVLGGVSSTLETLADFLLVRLQEPSGDPVNDPPLEAPPVATDDLLNTTERALLTGNLITDDNGQGIDLDEHPQTLVVSAVNGIAAKVGATTWLSSGSKVVVNADGSFTYDPNGRFDRVNYEEVVVESFTYTLKDDSGLESTATVTVRVHGEDDGFTFSGSTLQVNGGVGGDVLRYNAQFGRITLNGLHASLGDDIVLVTIDGHDGDDRITVLGTLGDDQFQLHPNRLVMEHDSTHTGYELVVVNVEAATLFGQGGADSGNLFDSHGDDRIVCRPNGVALIGGGSSREMIGFGQVRAVATLGYDRVLLVGGDAVDRLIVRPDVTVFQCGDRQLSLEGFNLIVSRAPGAGDEVQFHGSEAGDALRGRPGLAVFSVDGVNVHAEGFELVSANGAGGADRAMLFGDQGDDSLAVTPNSAVFLSGGVQFNTQSFDKLIVRAGQGGNDVATLVDSNGDDLFVGEEDRAHLQGLGFNSLAERFHVVRLRGINGGFNRLTLADPLQFELLQQGSWN